MLCHCSSSARLAVQGLAYSPDVFVRVARRESWDNQGFDNGLMRGIHKNLARDKWRLVTLHRTYKTLLETSISSMWETWHTKPWISTACASWSNGKCDPTHRSHFGDTPTRKIILSKLSARAGKRKSLLSSHIRTTAPVGEKSFCQENTLAP